MTRCLKNIHNNFQIFFIGYRRKSFKVKEQNSKNHRKNKENDPLQECFPTCGCQICTETFFKDIQSLLPWLQKLSVKNRYFLNIVQFK